MARQLATRTRPAKHRPRSSNEVIPLHPKPPAFLVIAVSLIGPRLMADTPVVVTVDPSVRHQTILGWGKATPWLPASRMLRDQAIDRAVNDMGINRLRFEGLCGNSTRRRSWEWLNDNDDPFDINWPAFNTEALDARVTEWLVPWKQAVEARSEPFDLYVSPSFFRGGSTGDVPAWMLNDPQEYAEWAEALLRRLRDTHGITADYYAICNEAGNGNAFSPQVVARMAKALMPRLAKLQFPTVLQFPESINAHVAWRYIEALRDDPDIWDWVGLIAYHWYGKDNQSSMTKLRGFAQQRGLPTAQTEFMNLKIDHLYDDMVLGGVSYWEVYGLCTPDYKAALSHVSSTAFRGGRWYWQFRQVSHYVRPGAVRVGADCSDPAIRALAFSDAGKPTLVLINTAPAAQERAISVAGLAPGRYGVSRSVGPRPYEELGLRRVADDGRLGVRVPAGAVLTLYPHSGANLPPTVTAWRSEPDYLKAPVSSVKLMCSAVDSERDPLSFRWSLVGRPAGAAVGLSEPDAATTVASGLVLPGDYVFAVKVSDGVNTVKRDVLVKAFAGNRPPVPLDVHNRIPVWVTVRDGGTLLRSGAWDIEDDPVTFRWSVAAQPEGASAALLTPDKQACKAQGMTVAGDYVFRLQVSDPTHTVAVDHTVPVYP